MNPLYSVAEIRAAEAAAAASLPPGALMQRAGQAAANAALDLLPFSTSRARVLVLAGPGNNGGDALEAAAHLAHAGATVRVLYWAPSGAPSAEREEALRRARASTAGFSDPQPEALDGMEWNLVIDGLFGIGLARPVSGMARQLVQAVSALPCAILALDVPSGLDADTGAVVGPDGVAVRATHTLTFIADKPGLHTCDGRDHAGTVDVARLEIGPALLGPASMHLNDPGFFARHLQVRRQNSHKGSYGNVAVLGGAHGMAGAPILSARAALHSGAGRVYVLFAGDAPAYDSGQPELMCRHAADFDADQATLVAGPGLGTAPAAAELLARAIASASPLLADADALNLLAADTSLHGGLCDAGALKPMATQPPLATALAARAAPTVLTPHPLEAARLLGVDTGAIQADRVAAARTLAQRYRSVVVLKGSGSVIARPDGQVVINGTGNPALSTAGTGDVLSGLGGALLAQGWPAWEAALGAVWLHGMAADVLVAEGQGPIGLAAGELIPAIRTALNQLARQPGVRSLVRT